MSVALRPVRTQVQSETGAERRNGTCATQALSALFLAAAVAAACNGPSVLAPDPATCKFDVAPTAQQLSRGSQASGRITVATTGSCTWAATTDVSWIKLTRLTSGRGNGWVDFEVAVNVRVGDASQRTGSVTIAGQRSTITQAGEESTTACTFTLDPASQTIGAAGGPGTPVRVVTGPCRWTATSDVPWITVTGGASGLGDNFVAFSVEANTGAARTGTITIADRTATISQTAAGAAAPRPPLASTCPFTILPNVNAISVGALDRGSIAVMTAGTCRWTAISNDAWITILSGASGTGSGVVSYSVASNNTGSSRRGTITIAGLTFTFAQAALTGPLPQTPCVYTLSQENQPVKAFGGKGSFSLTTANYCGWSAVSNDTWITILTGDSGRGNGTVTFFVAPNFGPDRRGTLTVAGRKATVIQGGW